MSQTPKRPRGRPRSPEARRKVLQAAQAILSEEGLGRLTIEAVAARSGVGKPTIYRTWANAQELAMAALLGRMLGPDALWPTDPEEALRDQIRRLVEVFGTGRGRQVAQVLAAADPESELARAFRTRVILAAREEGRDLLKRLTAEGRIARPADWEVVLDLLYAPVLFRLLMGHQPLSPDFAETLVATVLAGLRPLAPARPAR